MLVDDGAAYLERYGKGSQGAGWYSFDQGGVHFVGLVNVVDLKAGGLGQLGDEQLEWLEDDLAGRSASTPIVVFAHIPLWTVYPEWGWGTDGRRAGAGLPQAVRLGHRAQRPHPPGDAEGRGQRHLPHRDVDRVPAARARRGGVARADEGAGRPAAAAAGHQRHRLQPAARARWRSSTSRWRSPERVRLPVLAGRGDCLLAAALRRGVGRSRPVTIAIANFTFEPPALTVPAGTEVTWVNQDDIPHLVDAADGAFRSPPLDTDDRFTLRLDRAGHDQLFLRPAPAHDRHGQVVAAPAPS